MPMLTYVPAYYILELLLLRGPSPRLEFDYSRERCRVEQSSGGYQPINRARLPSWHWNLTTFYRCIYFYSTQWHLDTKLQVV